MLLRLCVSCPLVTSEGSRCGGPAAMDPRWATSRRRSPAHCSTPASQGRPAVVAISRKAPWRSDGEFEMAARIPAVAACSSRASESSLVSFWILHSAETRSSKYERNDRRRAAAVHDGLRDKECPRRGERGWIKARLLGWQGATMPGSGGHQMLVPARAE